MAKGENQKLKMLLLQQLFLTETDEQHPLTAPQIIEKLNDRGVTTDRKTLYFDLDELRSYGLDLIAERHGRSTVYYVGARDFELPELKLLVDAVQSSKFITEKKSRELIGKLSGLVSRYQARHLQRQVTVSGRIKAMNESIYYNVDRLHEAIGADRQIRFKYYRWNVDKEMELRKDGRWYVASPWGLMWDDENYYLVAYDRERDRILHYRVDKMLQIEELPEPREGRDVFDAFDLPSYTKTLFGMFGGELTRVTLEAENEMVGVLIDRFGKDIPIRRTDESHFRTTVDVTVSRQFLGWVFAIGSGVRITGPEPVVAAMREASAEFSALYAGS